MEIQLTATQTTSWNTNPDWRDGFLAALIEAVDPTFQVVVIKDDGGATLAAYKRTWTAT